MGCQILSNGLLILPSRTAEGSIAIEGGRIAEVLPGKRYSEGLDLGGRFLAPGLIDIHTDYLEREILPRPDTQFPVDLAFHLMDLRAVSCGLTTVLGAARISNERSGPLGSWHGDGLELAGRYLGLRENALGRYYVHVRWDPNFEPCEDALADLEKLLPAIGNLVFNESIPGERQFKNTFEDQVRRQAALKGVTPDQMREIYEEKARTARQVDNRRKVFERFGSRLPLGSHDDTTEEHVIEAFQNGCSLSEMPVTIEAARKAKELGMQVCMGAPNYYRGGSHCGNLSCRDAIRENLVDILCSDYHFGSLLGSVMQMIDGGTPPHKAFDFVSSNPARHLGIYSELGSIETGKRADLVCFDREIRFGRVVKVWVDGSVKFDMLGRHEPQSRFPLRKPRS